MCSLFEKSLTVFGPVKETEIRTLEPQQRGKEKYIMLWGNFDQTNSGKDNNNGIIRTWI